MSVACPQCNAMFDEGNSQCPSCGHELDLFQTIPPPRFGGAPSGPPRESKPASVAPPPREREPASESRERRPPEPAPAPVAVKRRPKPTPAPAPRAAAPTPPPQAAAPVYVPPPPPPAQPVQDAAAPGKLRRWLISQLGGQAAPQPPPGYAYQPGASQESAAAFPPVTPAYGVTPGTAPLPPAPLPFERSHTPAPPPAEEEGAHTMALGADLAKFKMASGLLTLQILDRHGQWHDWTTIGAGGLKVGRTEKNPGFAELNSMAVRHMRIAKDGERILVQDLGSVNGVYLKINRPVEIQDGQRFRVGTQVIEFQKAESLPPCEPLVSEDGEAFWSRDVDAFAYLQFIRADGKPGLRFPVTQPNTTSLGRESRPGKAVNIALPSDDCASGQHSLIRREGEKFFLEDLGSRNGTFIQLQGASEILIGDVLLVGRVLLRIVDPRRMPREGL